MDSPSPPPVVGGVGMFTGGQVVHVDGGCACGWWLCLWMVVMHVEGGEVGGRGHMRRWHVGGARLVGDMFACWLETESIEQVVV